MRSLVIRVLSALLTLSFLLTGCTGSSVSPPTQAARPAATGSTLAAAESPAQPPSASAQPHAPSPQIATPQAAAANAYKAEGDLRRRDSLGALPESLARSSPAREHKLAPQPMLQMPLPENRERYTRFEDNPIKLAAEHPVSTFSIDVDTASYSNVRRFLNHGRLPPPDAVRVEEMINYFPYDYAGPAADGAPFAIHTELAPAPWKPANLILRVALKGRDLAKQALPPANLVFLVDVSGSMQSADKLPLLKSALGLLVEQLRPQDRVAIVTYAAGTAVALEPTSGRDKARIRAAIEALQAGGSTHGEAGIVLAYAAAQQGYIAGGINRVLLATDGDFNVGLTDQSALKGLIEDKRKSGVGLSTLGFGTGNLNDALMKQLADAGDGKYSYVDSLSEGQKVLVDEFTSTLATIARDVKIQLEFNPAAVREYRLIGYEARVLRREDFNNDQVDAGDIGAGHTVTALYEITPVGASGAIDPLRYAPRAATSAPTAELAFLRLRYKAPDRPRSQLVELPIRADTAHAAISGASPEFRFALAVAAFGQQLRGGRFVGGFGYDRILQLARTAAAEDRYGHRAEFVRLVSLARSLATARPGDPGAMTGMLE